MRFSVLSSLLATGVAAVSLAADELKIPDILIDKDGNKITTVEQWEKRRPEIRDLMLREVYGFVPVEHPEMEFKVMKTDFHAMNGTATLKQVRILLKNGDQSLPLNLILFIPKSTPKAKVFLLICNRDPNKNIDPARIQKTGFWPAEEIVARGYAAAAFYNGEIDPDKFDDFKDGVHGLFDQERKADSWGTLSAWAWGASRCLDYLEKDPDVDASKVAVVGQSRGGKTALIAGAFDPRFAMAISNNSGCGGAALSKRKVGETVKAINDQFPHWFCLNFRKYNNHEDAMPFDQHFLTALIAPRPVYHASASEDAWADPMGEFMTLQYADPVYRLYGLGGMADQKFPEKNQSITVKNMGYHLHQGPHDLTPWDWQKFMDFADFHWKKNNTTQPPISGN